TEHAGVPAVLLYLAVAGVAAKLVLNKVAELSAYLSAVDLRNSPDQAVVAQKAQDRLDQASATVQNVENILVNVLLVRLVLVAVIVLIVVIWQFFSDPYQTPPTDQLQRRGLARWVDPVRQPVLDGLVRVPWSHWFFGLLVVFGIFAALFWIIPATGSDACAN